MQSGACTALPAGACVGTFGLRLIPVLLAAALGVQGRPVRLLDDSRDVKIAETRSGMLFPPKNIDALLARGYWTATDNVNLAYVLAMVTATPSQ
jgi:hypothetical protein